MKKTLIRFLAITVILALMVLLCPTSVVHAGALTAKSDTLSTLTASVAANHTFQFTLATGNTFATTETIVITFPAGFDLTGLANTDVLDYDIKTDTGGTPAEESIVASGGCAANDAIEITSIVGQVITFTACGSYTATPTAAGIEIQIGTHASTGGDGNTQITNPTAGEKTISLAAGGDTGDIVVDIIADDSVAVSATVNASLTFAITDVSIGFGTLVVANSRFATVDGSGLNTATSGNALTIATNTPSGYTLTYNGATLTDTAPTPDTTIDVATVTGDADGEPGTEQFAIGFSTNGNATITSTYAQASNNYKFVASTTTAITTETEATATETFSAYYLANISGNTEAGSYSTSITYIANGNF